MSCIRDRVCPMTENIDSRPFYLAALAWARDVAAHVPADRMADKTPCTEWNVRELLGHLVATVDRARAGEPAGRTGPVRAAGRAAAGVRADGGAGELVRARPHVNRWRQ